jgi:hypothetical protein
MKNRFVLSITNNEWHRAKARNIVASIMTLRIAMPRITALVNAYSGFMPLL